MKIHTILFIASLMLLASCSKSLTDIGYSHGVYAYHESSFSDVKGAGYIPKFSTPTQANPDLEIMKKIYVKECTKFLNKFYKSLTSAKFNTKKFSAKYLPLCSIDVERAISDESNGGKAPKGGWEAFLPYDNPNAAEYTIAYDNKKWFNITFTSNRTIAIKLDIYSAAQPPVIVNVKEK